MGVRISAIIPVWNGRADLERLLRTLNAQTRKIDDIVVVDNGSADPVEGLAAQWGARTVRFAENRGFAAAVNRGVAASRGELLAILNNDVALAPEWAEQLEASMSQHSAWFGTGLILSARKPGRVDGAWDLVSKAGMPWRAGSGAQARLTAFRQGRRVAIASFTAVLLRRGLWERVGPLDERFESYLEDVDFGLRCAAAGYSGYYEPRAICYHQGSATLGRWHSDSVRRMSRNQLFLVWKHFPPELQRDWRWNLVVGQTLWSLLAFRHGAGLAWFRGKWEAIRRRQEFPPHGSEDLRISVENQEYEIFALQREFGFDSYWRWYGWLTGVKLRLNDTEANRE